MILQAIPKAVMWSLCLAALCVTEGCADRSPVPPAPPAEKSDLFAISIETGRYGVMLDQARGILNLPEPSDPAVQEGPDTDDESVQRAALARFQVALAREFFADARAACAIVSIPTDVRDVACAHRDGPPDSLKSAANDSLGDLQQRSDALGALIMPWWNAACALAPPPSAGDPGACAIE